MSLFKKLIFLSYLLMKNIKTVLLVASLAAFTLLLFNCGSPDDTVWIDDGVINDSTQTGITIDKVNYNDYEATLINSEDLFIDQSYYGSIDNQSVKFYFILKRCCHFRCKI